MAAGSEDFPDRSQVENLFHRAVDLPTGERTAFVHQESAGNEALAREVLSLLTAHDRTGFLDASAMTPQDLIAAKRVGQRIGHYRIVRILGEGGMGVVYLAEDERLNHFVALKAISPAVAANPEARARLHREARAAAALRGYAGIATIYTLEEFNGELFIVSEYVEGETLRAEIERGPADATRVLADALELGRALAAAHGLGIVHRDLKPENVIRSSAGVLKILDFGLARMRDTPADTRLTHEGRVFGTPGYMSPEQIRRGPVDGRSDLFALGILLHERLTGAHPFAAADSAATIARILEDQPTITGLPRPADSAAAIWHDKLVDIIRALVRKDAADRFASASALVAALEQLRDSGSGAIPAERTEWTPERRWWRTHELLTCAAYALLLVPIGFAANTLADDQQAQQAMWFFLAAMAAAVGAVAIRLHLWFEAESRPRDWNAQYSRSWRWLRVCDICFAAVMLALALTVRVDHNIWATTLVGGGVLVLISAMLIEPATTRAAFDTR